MPTAFARRGADLCFSMEITYIEALCGVKRKLLLPDGDELVIHIPGVVKAGVEWRITGRGLPHKPGRGDMVLNIIIKWPKKALTTTGWSRDLKLVPTTLIVARNVEKITSQQKDIWSSVIKSFL